MQLARFAGARVIATVGSAEKKRIVESWGADLALDYHSPTLDDEIRKFAEPRGGIDVWFETQREPTLERTVSLMAPRGRIVLMAGRTARPELPLGAFYPRDMRIIGFAMFNAAPEEHRVCARGFASLRTWRLEADDWQNFFSFASGGSTSSAGGEFGRQKRLAHRENRSDAEPLTISSLRKSMGGQFDRIRVGAGPRPLGVAPNSVPTGQDTPLWPFG